MYIKDYQLLELLHILGQPEEIFFNKRQTAICVNYLIFDLFNVRKPDELASLCKLATKALAEGRSQLAKRLAWLATNSPNLRIPQTPELLTFLQLPELQAFLKSHQLEGGAR